MGKIETNMKRGPSRSCPRLPDTCELSCVCLNCVPIPSCLKKCSCGTHCLKKGCKCGLCKFACRCPECINWSTKEKRRLLEKEAKKLKYQDFEYEGDDAYRGPMAHGVVVAQRDALRTFKFGDGWLVTFDPAHSR